MKTTNLFNDYEIDRKPNLMRETPDENWKVIYRTCTHKQTKIESLNHISNAQNF